MNAALEFLQVQDDPYQTMSGGTRNHNFRQGDRSEYLAVYLLSALGLVTQVPRQEDIGFDFICNLAEREKGTLSFRDHYAVSVKSASTPNILLAPPKSEEDSKDYADHYNWVFHLEIPLMLAVVDKDKQKLSLYSTLPAWFVFYENLANCGILELIPRMDDTVLKGDVSRPTATGPQEKAGGRNHYKVDLGYPVIELSTTDLLKDEILFKKKESLRRALLLGKWSALFAAMKAPFFWWFNMTIPGGYDHKVSNPDGYNGGTAFQIGTSRSEADLVHLLSSIAFPLASVALLFKAMKETGHLQAVREVMRLIPPAVFPDDLKNELPEVFK